MAVNFGMGSECVRAPGPAPTRMSTRKSSSAEYSISSTSGSRRWISSMKKTWRARMLLRMPVRSSFFCSTGPEVVVNVTSQFLGDDGGQSGLAQPGRAVEQHVVHGFAAHARRPGWRCRDSP